MRQRLMQRRYLFRAALCSAALAALLALWAHSPQASAAHPAATNATITITFTVTVQAGTPPSDVLFWFCADAQTDGTGCNEMSAQPDGTFTYQLTTTTSTTYQHIIIQWSHGFLPTNNGEIPAPPARIVCDYHPLSAKATDPRSYTCKADFTAADATPTPPSVTATPTLALITDPTGTAGGDTSTLVTGLQLIIGLGLGLFVILLIILIWQRMSARRR